MLLQIQVTSDADAMRRETHFVPGHEHDLVIVSVICMVVGSDGGRPREAGTRRDQDMDGHRDLLQAAQMRLHLQGGWVRRVNEYLMWSPLQAGRQRRLCACLEAQP